VYMTCILFSSGNSIGNFVYKCQGVSEDKNMFTNIFTHQFKRVSEESEQSEYFCKNNI